MTDQAQPRFWSGIDVPKTLAGTLAALSAAVIGSFLGLAGTIIGAALASLISSIGTEVYHRSIDRGTKRLQSAFVTAPAAVGTPEVAAADEPPSEEKKAQPVKRDIRWKRVGLIAAALFVVALGSLTAVELMAGKTAADAVNGRDGGSPTLLNFSGDSGSGKDAEQAPAEAPASEAPGTTAPTEPTAGTPEPATETADPTTAPTTAPATEPTDTPTTGTGTETGEPAAGGDNAGDTQETGIQEGTDSGR